MEFYMFVESTCQTFLNYWVAIWIWYASYNFEAPFLQGEKNLAKFVIKYWNLEIYVCGKIIIYFMTPQNFTMTVETVEKYKVSGKLKQFF